MKLTATFPDGAMKTLLQIDDWDFAWQDQYPFDGFRARCRRARGSTATITYDNSADNPRNPSHPPVRVTWGEQSTDEMGVGRPPGRRRHKTTSCRDAAGRLREHVREAAMTRPGLRRLMMLEPSRGPSATSPHD